MASACVLRGARHLSKARSFWLRYVVPLMVLVVLFTCYEAPPSRARAYEPRGPGEVVNADVTPHWRERDGCPTDMSLIGSCDVRH